jgi:hypothetical protein
MNGKDIVFAARQLYLEQFRDFIAKRRAACPQGAAEVLLSVENNDGSPPVEYQGLICADFVEAEEGKTTFWEFDPPRSLTFEPVGAHLHFMAIDIEGLRWDNVFAYYEPAVDLTEALAPWFDTWFDPGGKRVTGPGDEFSGVVHRLIQTPTHLCIDFGTAPADAFESLLETLAGAGIQRLRISARAPA